MENFKERFKTKQTVNSVVDTIFLLLNTNEYNNVTDL